MMFQFQSLYIYKRYTKRAKIVPSLGFDLDFIHKEDWGGVEDGLPMVL